MTTSIEEALRSGAVLAGADHKRIWLEPYPGGPEGRTWCEDKVWPEHEGDPEPTEYVRADIHQSEVIGLMKTLAAYTDRALAAEAKCDALREALKKLLGTAVLLAGQAEGCIVSHHSEDHAAHGLPGWYRDCVADIAAARAITRETNDV